MFVPPHFEWLPIDVDQIVYSFVVYLHERQDNFVHSLGVVAAAHLPKQMLEHTRYQTWVVIRPFNCVGLARPSLPVRKNSRMVAL